MPLRSTSCRLPRRSRCWKRSTRVARAKDPRVAQVSASLLANWSVIEIVRPDGYVARDIRPLVRLNVSIVAEQNGRRETGSFGFGGRYLYDRLFDEGAWLRAIDESVRQALVNLDSVAAPAGEQTVLLGPGWPGVLLHEAVGHGLEGDFNRKGTSAFSGRIGERVAAPGVTVIDDGSIAERRGSLSIDDEGTPTGRTVLIEDGILKGYMQDRLNARLMGVEATGNGRRQNYQHAPMPRMTNTFMEGGTDDPAELLARVEDGIYATSFGGGQVDIVSGKFVFACTEAYKVEKGKIVAPIKGATLIGDGPSVLTRVTGIGNDMALDEGIGGVRQGRTGCACRRRPAYAADRRHHRGRNGLSDSATIHPGARIYDAGDSSCSKPSPQLPPPLPLPARLRSPRRMRSL